MSIAYGTNSADRSKAQQAWAKSQQSMASKYGIKPSNAMTYSFGQATPKSSDQQQGQLAEPPKQDNRAAQQQFGSAQASGDYSAYAPSGGYSAYSPQVATPEYWASQRNQQHPTQGRQQYGGSQAGWPPGYSGPGSSPMERMPQALPPPPPDSNGDGVPDVNGAPVGVQRPDGVQRQIDDMKRRGTWDDPRNAKARARLEQELSDINEAPPGYFKTPDGRFEPNYLHSIATPGSDRPAYGSYDMPASQQAMPVPAVAKQLDPATLQQVQQQYAAQAAPQRYVFPLQGQGQQFYNQRDAFINNINTSLGQQMMQNFGGSQPVAPQLNIPQLWNQAGQMAANGWTNPLAALIGNV